MTKDSEPGRDPFTVPVPDPMDQMDAIRKRRGEGRHMRLPWPRELSGGPAALPGYDHEASTEVIERDLAMSRWLRDWLWSQQFAPPGPMCVVTGI